MLPIYYRVLDYLDFLAIYSRVPRLSRLFNTLEFLDSLDFLAVYSRVLDSLDSLDVYSRIVDSPDSSDFVDFLKPVNSEKLCYILLILKELFGMV